MTRRRWIWIGALFCVVVVGVAVIWPTAPEPEPEPLRIPPVRHADGSVEYRLISFGEDGVRGTEDDPVWVLRLPPGTYSRVRYADASEEKIQEVVSRAPEYMFNWSLSLAFGLPGLVNIADPFALPPEEVLKVSLRAWEREYGSGQYHFFEQSFSSTADRVVNLECRRGDKIAPGLHRLRQPTEAEIAAIENAAWTQNKPAPGAYEFRGRCRVGKDDSGYYAVYDSDDRIIGTGDCYRSEVDLEGDAWCQFWFWVPPGRDVGYSFTSRHLPSIRDIHGELVAFLAAATDYEQSRNIQE